MKPKEYADIALFEKDVQYFFSIWIDKKPEDIRNIVIVGGYSGIEIPNYLARYPNATVYVIEPNPLATYYIHKEFAYCPRVILFCCACSEHEGVEEFYETTQEGNGSLLRVIDNENIKYNFSYKVIVKQLRNLVPKEIDLLQIDVQGAEMLVLKGTDLSDVSTLYIEAQNKKYWLANTDKTKYEGQCFFEDIEQFLKSQFVLHSMAFDKNDGSGNSFWVRNCLMKEKSELKLDYVQEWLMVDK